MAESHLLVNEGVDVKKARGIDRSARLSSTPHGILPSSYGAVHAISDAQNEHRLRSDFTRGASDAVRRQHAHVPYADGLVVRAADQSVRTSVIL